MKAKFELKNFMTENREVVISKFEALQNEQFYNGISLKSFMIEIFNSMVRNNVKSEKTATSKLSFLMGQIYVENSRVEGRDMISEKLENKYKGTAFIAMV
jgi:hypothetical protein